MIRRARSRAAAVAAKHVALVPLFDAVWLTWDAYTERLAHRIGDDADRLQWYCGDNDMGAKGLEAHSLTRSIKVRTLRQLAGVIAGSRTS